MKKKKQVKEKTQESPREINFIAVPEGVCILGESIYSGAATSFIADTLVLPHYHRPYLITDTPVTNHQYGGDALERDYPVVNVNIYDAFAFANKRSLAEGRVPAYYTKEIATHPLAGSYGSRYIFTAVDEHTSSESELFVYSDANGYFLPSPELHERAARGGPLAYPDYFLYAGSDDPKEVAWFSENSGGKPKKVALLKPNQIGGYDFSGLVWDWTTSAESDSREALFQRFKQWYVSLQLAAGIVSE